MVDERRNRGGQPSGPADPASLNLAACPVSTGPGPARGSRFHVLARRCFGSARLRAWIMRSGGQARPRAPLPRQSGRKIALGGATARRTLRPRRHPSHAHRKDCSQSLRVQAVTHGAIETRLRRPETSSCQIYPHDSSPLDESTSFAGQEKDPGFDSRMIPGFPP